VPGGRRCATKNEVLRVGAPAVHAWGCCCRRGGGTATWQRRGGRGERGARQPDVAAQQQRQDVGDLQAELARGHDHERVRALTARDPGLQALPPGAPDVGRRRRPPAPILHKQKRNAGADDDADGTECTRNPVKDKGALPSMAQATRHAGSASAGPRHVTASLTGQQAQARSTLGGAARACRSCTSGARYASVLPEPVGAATSASRPASSAGSAARCTAVGAAKPTSSRWSASDAARPRPAKLAPSAAAPNTAGRCAAGTCCAACASSPTRARASGGPGRTGAQPLAPPGSGARAAGSHGLLQQCDTAIATDAAFGHPPAPWLHPGLRRRPRGLM